MGICQYRYNPSEVYQRTPPGCGVESQCGAATYPIHDEPEMAVVRVNYPNGAGGTDVVDEAHPTGRLLPRPTDDPYCPAHGGTEEPEAPPVPVAELEAAYQHYVTLAEQYRQQPGGAITAAVPAPAELTAPVTAPAELAAPVSPPAGAVQDAAPAGYGDPVQSFAQSVANAAMAYQASLERSG